MSQSKLYFKLKSGHNCKKSIAELSESDITGSKTWKQNGHKKWSLQRHLATV